VLDTNVLISGIFFSGPPAEILKAWREGIIQFSLSSEIIDEYIRVSKILEDRFPSVEVNHILTLIVTHSDITQAPPLSHQVCEDPDDDKFLSCALASGSKTIISGDKHLLKTSGYRGIVIITPRAFVQQYLKKQART
jgi:putative PIN family toxin of toxin-antitoxin system